MIPALVNHLWQSTVFGVGTGLLAFALRRNRAQVRYCVWLTASLKFFVPFALLMALGSHFHWAPAAREMATQMATPEVSYRVVQISQPFPAALPTMMSTGGNRDWIPNVIFAVWVCGFAYVATIRLRGWLRIRAAVRASSAMNIAAPVAVRSSPGLLEPGVVGFLRPVLLMPGGIEERLTPAQLEAVLAHELCHVRRRDNLFASLHMVVEATFWFLPRVWWIGARLVEERERACDEEVLGAGADPQVYAEAILNVCKLYVESPLVCVAGVTGADIKKRIEAIMRNRSVLKLNFGEKLLLALAGVAALGIPLFAGVLNAPAVLAQAQSVQTLPQPPARIVAQAAAPVPGGRGAAPQPAPAGTAQTEYDRRVAYSQATFGTPPNAMGRTYILYGPPDQIDDRGSNAQNPSQIWRYNYLEAFHGNVEFEFAQAKGVRINWPLPVTYQGEPVQATDTNTDTSVASPSWRASMQIYPAKAYRTLTFPMDSLSSPVDVIAQVVTRLDTGAPGAVVANVREKVQLQASAAARAYTANFTLDAGSYVCKLLVREQSTGRMYTETIDFEVK